MDPTPPQKPRTPPRIALNSSDSGQSCSTETPLAELSCILSVLRCILRVLVVVTSLRVRIITRRRVAASLMVAGQTVDTIMTVMKEGSRPAAADYKPPLPSPTLMPVERRLWAAAPSGLLILSDGHSDIGRWLALISLLSYNSTIMYTIQEIMIVLMVYYIT